MQLLTAAPAPSATTTATLCRHCHTTDASRLRGLCWACYYADGVRDQYPVTSKYGIRGLATSATAMPPCRPPRPMRRQVPTPRSAC
jgi:hypothetical protein